MPKVLEARAGRPSPVQLDLFGVASRALTSRIPATNVHNKAHTRVCPAPIA